MNKKQIFSTNPNTHGNAYLNWRMCKEDDSENLYQMGCAYGYGAKLLLKDCLSNNFDYRADALIFPIMFGINQYIELSAKSIIRKFEIIDDAEIKQKPTHDISSLLSQLKDIIKSHRNGDDDGLDKHLEPVQSYIDELYPLIKSEKGKPHIDYARYPMDTDGNSFFYVSYENVTVDLTNLNERFLLIMDAIDSLYYYCIGEQDLKNEMISMDDMRDYGDY